MAARWAPFTHRGELVITMPGHVVTRPNGGRHQDLRLMTDVELLLADTIASVRMNRPAAVFELAACARCQEAYAQARKVIEDAGGIAKWMESVARP
jgi:hypothetical protein